MSGQDDYAITVVLTGASVDQQNELFELIAQVCQQFGFDRPALDPPTVTAGPR